MAYAAAWKRRGERISVIPNIARKVDRLTSYADNGSEMADEHLLDTAVDLYVYSLKYLLFLAEQSAELEATLALVNSKRPLSDHVENFAQLVDTGQIREAWTTSTKEIINAIATLFETLWRIAEADAPMTQRFGLVRQLVELAEGLVDQIARDDPASLQEFVAAESKYAIRSSRESGLSP